MTHRGGRSPQARIRRLAKRYVARTSYRDHIQAESVCKVTSHDILSFLREQFPDQPINVSVARFIKGEILSDARGRGSFQVIR